MTIRILHGDCLDVLPQVQQHARLAYMDPPFNTGEVQRGLRGCDAAYADAFGDFTGWLMPRIQATIDRLTPDGAIMVHLDEREVHYVKVALDKLLGRDKFMNEIIWAYDYGGRSRRYWPKKHDTILWYVMDPDNYIFNLDASDRLPYMAPSLVGAEKAARGKTPTDVHWHTVCPTQGPERTGYPSQKPLGLLKRFVAVHSMPGDVVIDPFAGSGTTGQAAVDLGRDAILIDSSVDAVSVMRKRFESVKDVSTPTVDNGV